MKKKFTNDDQLFKAVMNGDKQAIEQFRKDKITPFTRYALKYTGNEQDAKGIAIKVFYKTLESGKTFDNLKQLSKYIYKGVWYACQDFLKGQTGYIAVGDVEHTLISDQNIEADIIKAEHFYALYKQIKKLPRKTDQQILLLTLKGIKPVEIARETGLTDRYVRKRIIKLGNKMRNQLIASKIITVLFLLFFI